MVSLPNVETVGATEDSWVTKASMPTARSEFGVAVVNGKIYAIGGYGNGCLNVNEEYDPATNTWATKKPMPTARGSFAIAVYQNKIYVMGGSIGFDWAKEESILCSFNEVYDPLTDTWETKTSMPTNRSQLNANVVNGKIYLIGGRTGGQYTTVSLNEVYDPSTDTWTTKEPIPYPVVKYASAVVDNKIYVIGGQDEFHPDVNVAFNQIYDPETDIWSYGASLPTAVWQAAAGATTGIMAPKRIYVVGGMPRHDADGTNITQVYNPENDTWTFGASMPTARCGLTVAVVNDVLYAIGGHPGFMVLPPNYAKNEQYTPFGYAAVNGTIIIRSDGKVDPGTAPIQRDGNVYTFTRNIHGEIIVEKDKIVVDGAGYTLQGTGRKGIDLSDRSNVTIQNVEIKEFNDGIWIYNASNNTITGNTITANNQWGIRLAGSSNNNVSGNKITNNDYGGIVFMDSDNNTISGNTITNNFVGLDFTASENNIVSGNLIADNDEDGIHLENVNNSIIENTITNNGDVGILLHGAGYNSIIGNNITNNRRGILVSICYNNVIYHNNFVENTFHIETDESNGIWDNGKEGNFWDDYTGVDSNGDGIGDTPHFINENNIDNYPLMNPWFPPPTPEPQPSEPFPTWIAATTVIVAIALIGAALLIYFAKIRKTTGEIKEQDLRE